MIRSPLQVPRECGFSPELCNRCMLLRSEIRFHPHPTILNLWGRRTNHAAGVGNGFIVYVQSDHQLSQGQSSELGGGRERATGFLFLSFSPCAHRALRSRGADWVCLRFYAIKSDHAPPVCR